MACLQAFAKIQEVAPQDHDFREQRESLIVKVKSLVAQMESLSVAETLAVASSVESEPMIECLIKVDQHSWRLLTDIFVNWSVEDRKK